MSNTIAQLAKWCLIPVLVITSMFSYFTGRFEPVVDAAVCLGAIILIQRAVWSKQYFWAAGLVAIVVCFSGLQLTVKIFLLIGITCIATCAVFLDMVRPRAVEAV